MKNNRLTILFFLVLGFISCEKYSDETTENETKKDLTAHVNPFIGTGGHGHTYPGAVLPNGMMQLSPDTRTSGWDACSGYHYPDTSIMGFSHTHLSGTGIGDYGDFLFMPFTGETKLNPGTEKNPDSGYRSRFSHKNEKASPGYYSVFLDDYDIKVELTASSRSGMHRYTYPKEADSKKLIIDLSHSIHNKENLKNEIRVISNTEVEGYRHMKGWAKNRHIYFYAKFDQPFTYSLYSNNEKLENTNIASSKNIKAVLNFENIDASNLLIKVGVSSVDFEGARNNLEKEMKDWDFNSIKSTAQEIWNEQLNKIIVSGGGDDQKKILYTGLYHASLSPHLFSDVDGRFRGMDQEIHQSESPVYTVFSLWDTFRGLHPLMTIIDPEKNNEYIRSLLIKNENGGILPKWELAANYTGTMVGYHAIPVIYDAYKKGIRNFDVNKAYSAMKKAATYDSVTQFSQFEPVQEKLMPKAKKYNEELGFIPSDLENESVSKALEYAYDDWCIAQMAKDLGKTKDYEVYSERAGRYKKYFDPETGFMRGKNADGSWKQPFHPRYSRHRVNTDYTEGNAWQWSWFAPHDVEGLVSLMGGKSAFTKKLDSLFSITSEIEGEKKSADISGLIGQYAHGNEPSHHITHLYNFVGEPWKTQKLTDSIMTSLYFNAPNGLAGNEDAGQMSAWYILNAMGFYSFLPGSGEYSLGRPLFDEVKIRLKGDKYFTIKTNNNSEQNKYIQSASINGKTLEKPFFNHQDIIKDGTLEINMGPEPNKNWGI